MIPPHLMPLLEATHEALGRAIRKEDIGEPDLRNAMLFAHHLLATFAQYGLVLQPKDIQAAPTVQRSASAKYGPAAR